MQWTVVDSNYSRFSLPTCQTNLIGNGSGGGGGNSNNNNNNNSSNNNSAGNNNNNNSNNNSNSNNAGSNSDSGHSVTNETNNTNGSNNNNNNNNNNSVNNSVEQQRQQQQQQQQDASNNQHLQQLNFQQQQQHNVSGYTPQIISVNSLVSGYATTNVAGGQKLSPTSPNESNLVQTVYSQGPTPTQSPVHVGNTSSAGGNANSSNISTLNLNNNGNGSGNGIANTNTPQVIKRKRSVNPQGDENFIRALEAVRSGGIGFCKAARLYGVNNRTLWLEYRKRGYPVSRPSIKSRIVKQEPNLSPSPTPSNNVGDDTNTENYEHLAAAAAAQTAALNMQIPAQSETTTPSLLCGSHHAAGTGNASSGSHPTMGVMSFLETRHIDFPASLHSMSRQRYIDGSTNSGSAAGGTINVNQAAAMNLQSINFNSI